LPTVLFVLNVAIVYVYTMYICTVKKEKKIFIIYKEIQKGTGANSYMRKGFLIYEKIFSHIRKPLVINDFALDPF
jgi:hypothetical protein